MGLLSNKIKGILEYEISLDLNAEVNRKKAAALIIITALIVSIAGYLLGETVFWGVDDRSVFDRQIEALKDAGSNNDNFQNRVDLALAYYLKGDLSEAQSLFKGILRQDKDNAAANIYYGLILADQKKYREAIPYLSQGIVIEPRREKMAYLYLGMSYYQIGDTDKALRYLDSSTKMDPGSPVGFYYLGLVYKKKNDFDSAKTAFQKALALSGSSYPEVERELKKLPRQSKNR